MRVLTFLSFLVTVTGNEVDSALQSDDQCVSAECSFNALQLRGLKEEMELEKEMDEAESESGWLKDISTKTKNHFKHILAPLQKPIVTNYQYLTVLDSYVNYTMQKVENATGHLVVWNRKSLLQTDDACIKLGAVFPLPLKQSRRKVLHQTRGSAPPLCLTLYEASDERTNRVDCLGAWTQSQKHLKHQGRRRGG